MILELTPTAQDDLWLPDIVLLIREFIYFNKAWNYLELLHIFPSVTVSLKMLEPSIPQPHIALIETSPSGPTDIQLGDKLTKSQSGEIYCQKDPCWDRTYYSSIRSRLHIGHQASRRMWPPCSPQPAEQR